VAVRSDWTVEWERQKSVCEAYFQPHLTEDDREWMRKHIELAGVRVPEVDISWITLTDGS
jgi:hypothetical protein